MTNKPSVIDQIGYAFHQMGISFGDLVVSMLEATTAFDDFEKHIYEYDWEKLKRKKAYERRYKNGAKRQKGKL